MVLGVLLVVGALAVVALTVVLVGRSLPVQHRASRRMHLGRTPQEVWDTVTDIEGFPAWRPGLTRVELLPEVDGRRRWVEHQRRDKITYEVSEAVPPRLLITRIADQGLPFGGTWTYEIEPSGEGCVVTVTEDGEVYNPFFRFVSRYVIGHTATLNRYLNAVAARFGEDAAIQDVRIPSASSVGPETGGRDAR
jgi:uncharacterized protein YndB with AHSA1/START domain